MPYLNEDAQKQVILSGKATSPGDLNFVFTTWIVQYLEDKGLSYQTCNDIVGALENCKNEFQRRIQQPYENQKLKENGDVYASNLFDW